MKSWKAPPGRFRGILFLTYVMGLFESWGQTLKYCDEVEEYDVGRESFNECLSDDVHESGAKCLDLDRTYCTFCPDLGRCMPQYQNCFLILDDTAEGGVRTEYEFGEEVCEAVVVEKTVEDLEQEYCDFIVPLRCGEPPVFTDPAFFDVEEIVDPYKDIIVGEGITRCTLENSFFCCGDTVCGFGEDPDNCFFDCGYLIEGVVFPCENDEASAIVACETVNADVKKLIENLDTIDSEFEYIPQDWSNSCQDAHGSCLWCADEASGESNFNGNYCIPNTSCEISVHDSVNAGLASYDEIAIISVLRDQGLYLSQVDVVIDETDGDGSPIISIWKNEIESGEGDGQTTLVGEVPDKIEWVTEGTCTIDTERLLSERRAQDLPAECSTVEIVEWIGCARSWLSECNDADLSSRSLQEEDSTDSSTTDSSVDSSIDSSTTDSSVDSSIDSSTTDSSVDSSIDSSTTDSSVDSSIDSSTTDSSVDSSIDSSTTDSSVDSSIDSSTTDSSLDSSIDSSTTDSSLDSSIDSSTTDSSLDSSIDSSTTDSSLDSSIDSSTTDGSTDNSVDSSTTGDGSADAMSIDFCDVGIENCRLEETIELFEAVCTTVKVEDDEDTLVDVVLDESCSVDDIQITCGDIPWDVIDAARNETTWIDQIGPITDKICFPGNEVELWELCVREEVERCQASTTPVDDEDLYLPYVTNMLSVLCFDDYCHNLKDFTIGNCFGEPDKCVGGFCVCDVSSEALTVTVISEISTEIISLDSSEGAIVFDSSEFAEFFDSSSGDLISDREVEIEVVTNTTTVTFHEGIESFGLLNGFCERVEPDARECPEFLGNVCSGRARGTCELDGSFCMCSEAMSGEACELSGDDSFFYDADLDAFQSDLTVFGQEMSISTSNQLACPNHQPRLCGPAYNVLEEKELWPWVVTRDQAAESPNGAQCVAADSDCFLVDSSEEDSEFSRLWQSETRQKCYVWLSDMSNAPLGTGLNFTSFQTWNSTFLSELPKEDCGRFLNPIPPCDESQGETRCWSGDCINAHDAVGVERCFNMTLEENVGTGLCNKSMEISETFNIPCGDGVTCAPDWSLCHAADIASVPYNSCPPLTVACGPTHLGLCVPSGVNATLECATRVSCSLDDGESVCGYRGIGFRETSDGWIEAEDLYDCRKDCSQDYPLHFEAQSDFLPVSGKPWTLAFERMAAYSLLDIEGTHPLIEVRFSSVTGTSFFSDLTIANLPLSVQMRGPFRDLLPRAQSKIFHIIPDRVISGKMTVAISYLGYLGPSSSTSGDESLSDRCKHRLEQGNVVVKGTKLPWDVFQPLQTVAHCNSEISKEGLCTCVFYLKESMAVGLFDEKSGTKVARHVESLALKREQTHALRRVTERYVILSGGTLVIPTLWLFMITVFCACIKLQHN